MTVLYPTRYGTRMVPLEQLKTEHHIDKMHPEFARRLFGWIEAQGGKVGIGGSWREDGSQPNKPGFAPEGKSFHQFQKFPSGVYFAAVDLVVAVPGQVHRAPRWEEVPAQGSDAARFWGVHCNVSSESWHMQPVINHIPGYDGLDGWQGWINRGQPDLQLNYGLKELTMKINPPKRLIDTRINGGAPGNAGVVSVPVGGTANAVFVNITIVDPADSGFATAWSGSGTMPTVSNVNYAKGQTVCNTSWVPVHNGRISVYTKSACHVVVDLQASA